MLWIAQMPVKYSQNNDTSEAQYQLWREGNVRSLKLPAHSVVGLWQPGTEPCIAGLHVLGVYFHLPKWKALPCFALARGSNDLGGSAKLSTGVYPDCTYTEAAPHAATMPCQGEHLRRRVRSHQEEEKQHS